MTGVFGFGLHAKEGRPRLYMYSRPVPVPRLLGLFDLI